jgi:hypothetical protein
MTLLLYYRYIYNSLLPYKNPLNFICFSKIVQKKSIQHRGKTPISHMVLLLFSIEPLSFSLLNEFFQGSGTANDSQDDEEQS